MKLFESTLRDGEQAAFIHLQPHQKAEIARSLEALGVDIIDAGFPIASRLDWEGAAAIADGTDTVQLSVLARHIPKDIEAAHAAVRKHRERSRLATWVMPYELYGRHANDPGIRQRIIAASRQAVLTARHYFPAVQYYLVYSGNREIGFLQDLAFEVAEAGACCIAVADSQSTLNPETTSTLVQLIRRALPASCEIAIHCHNNLGLALANSIAAIRAGATQVEVTIGGMGDAGGNTALEQILAYASFFESETPSFQSGCRLDGLYQLASQISAITGFQYGSNQPLLGRDTFTVETGIHQSLAANIHNSCFDPRAIGREIHSVLGRHSGVVGLRGKLLEIGIDPAMLNLNILYTMVMDACESEGIVSDAMLKRLVADLRMGTSGG